MDRFNKRKSALGPISSPCTGVCEISNGSCIGCGRTRDQIAGWASMSGSERKGIMRALGPRCPACHRVLPIADGSARTGCPDCETPVSSEVHIPYEG